MEKLAKSAIEQHEEQRRDLEFRLSGLPASELDILMATLDVDLSGGTDELWLKLNCHPCCSGNDQSTLTDEERAANQARLNPFRTLADAREQQMKSSLERFTVKDAIRLLEKIAK